MSKYPDPESTPLVTLNGFADPNVVRMLGVVTALAGEVYVLKAEVQRLTAALGEQKLVDPEMLDAAGQSEPMQAWLAQEQETFTAEVLRPWLEPDTVPDVRRYMSTD